MKANVTLKIPFSNRTVGQQVGCRKEKQPARVERFIEQSDLVFLS